MSYRYSLQWILSLIENSRIRFFQAVLVTGCAGASLSMFVPAYAQDEHITELGNKINPVKIKGLHIPYFGGGPSEEKVRTTVFKKQIALLEKANKRRPIVEDYMIALNVQLLHLQRFSDYRNHWLETFRVPDNTSKQSAIKKVSQSELDEHFKEQHELREREKEVKRSRNRDSEKVMPWKDLLPYGSREWNLRN